MISRAVSMVLLVLLAACSSIGAKRATGTDPAQLPSPPASEEIVEVTTDLPPLDDSEPSARSVVPPASTTSSSAGRPDPRKALEEARARGFGPANSSSDLPTIGGDPAVGFDEPARRSPTRYAYKPPDPASLPQAPQSGRVGIMNLLGNELRHVHSGTTRFGNHEKSYNVQYDFGGFVMEELRKSLLTRTPYQPVALASTGALRQAASSWQETWDGKSFAPTFQREFDGIMQQNRLDMIIVVSYRTLEGSALGGGQKLNGSGLYTRSSFGDTKAAVFSTLQFYRIVGKPARLIDPLAPDGERSIGDLAGAKLPEELEDLPARYLAPVYEPLRSIVYNKIRGLISLPRKLGS